VWYIRGNQVQQTYDFCTTNCRAN